MTIQRLALALALALAATLLPAAAEAQGGFFLGVGLGPAVGIEDSPTQVRFSEEIGYYFEGRPEGFFLSFNPNQSFGDDRFVLVLPARLGYMFEIYENQDLAVQIGPSGTVGFAIADLSNVSDAGFYFHFDIGATARLLLADGLYTIYLRPFDFDFGFGGGDFQPDFFARYIFEAGIQFHL